MTTTIVPTEDTLVKTVADRHAAYLAACAASTVAFATLRQHTFDPGAQLAYDLLLQAEQRAFHAWHEAIADDEAARLAFLCAQHDLECDLEYPRSYEDPIPYTITSAESRYLASHNPTRSGAAESYTDDLPF